MTIKSASLKLVVIIIIRVIIISIIEVEDLAFGGPGSSV